MNKQTTPKSTTAHITVLCLVLAAFCLPAAQLQAQDNGGPPGPPANQTFTIPGGCGFDVQVTVTGRTNLLAIPGGGFILTGPDFYATFTNLSDPTKSVTLNATGSEHFSFDANGDTIIMLTGHNSLVSQSLGIVNLIGNFTAVFDSDGNLIQGPTGNGQITSICDLIN